MKVLLVDIQRRIDMMETDIAHEEERTRVQDVAHPTYSILARNLRGRRDNLLATIAILKRRLDGRGQRRPDAELYTHDAQ